MTTYQAKLDEIARKKRAVRFYAVLTVVAWVFAVAYAIVYAGIH